MKALFDTVCQQCSVITTQRYSTSFSLGIRLLGKDIQPAIYGIYGFVRFADEIVDTFHSYNKAELLARFKRDTFLAIYEKISLNPILESFQKTVNTYQIDHQLIESFFHSMEMDLSMQNHDKKSYDSYIVGSAEVVGLMCLYVFVNGNKEQYEKLKPAAQKLGSAFQKVNFLRDIKFDSQELNRNYFPELDNKLFTPAAKIQIEKDIVQDFNAALVGIKNLPANSKLGVYVAYKYYFSLFNKIRAMSAERILQSRVRINNGQKIGLMIQSYFTMNVISD